MTDDMPPESTWPPDHWWGSWPGPQPRWWEFRRRWVRRRDMREVRAVLELDQRRAA